MSHHHHHHKKDHHHGDHHNSSSDTLTLDEKLTKLLDHWINHNDDHAKNYRDWGAQAKSVKLDEVADLLEEAAKMTEQISEKFIAAAAKLKPRS